MTSHPAGSPSGTDDKQSTRRLCGVILLISARAILNNRNIEFSEQEQESDELVFQSPDKRINARPGDGVIVSRWRAPASSFPCGYDMEIILLFGPDGKLKDNYISRFPMCP